jgi:uncharacterized protein YndB with AHSA1/START domain
MRPSRMRSLLFAVLAPLLIAPLARAEVLPVKKATLVFIPSKMELKAPPEKVWAALCTVKGFCTLTGFAPDSTARTRAFSRLGDAARATIWTDRGQLVVTGVVPMKELRVAWEPENAGYLCSKRILLTKIPTGTKLEVWDRYTDDQPNVDETAKTVAAETAKAEIAFRRLVEAR